VETRSKDAETVRRDLGVVKRDAISASVDEAKTVGATGDEPRGNFLCASDNTEKKGQEAPPPKNQDPPDHTS